LRFSITRHTVVCSMTNNPNYFSEGDYKNCSAVP
jgi:hypothetical protein